MWPQESEAFMVFMTRAEVRAEACRLAAARITTAFQQAMALYALAYSIDLAEGQCHNNYARGAISYWGVRHFPCMVQQAYQEWWAHHWQEHQELFAL